MNVQDQIPKPDLPLNEVEMDPTTTVDDFIKQLEAKEKDLHITADMQIEVAESDFDEVSIPDFVQKDLPNGASTSSSNGSGSQVGLKTRVYDLQNEVTTLNDRIRDLRIERNEIQEKSDRRLKDFENYKYRMDREHRGAFIDQIANLASQMLPVLDNLDRALESVEKLEREKSEEFQQFYDGIQLVNNQVNEVFAEMGVQAIATVGELFDPNFHEAVAVEVRADSPSNLILEEMLRGYRIGNRVIRHSMVKVTSSPPVPRLQTPAASEASIQPSTESDAKTKSPDAAQPNAAK